MKEFHEYEKEFGPWTAHNIEFAPGRFTCPKESAEELRLLVDACAFWLARFMKKPFAQCRLLDLGCLEGAYCYYFAQAGADVTGVEIRKDNLGRCSFLNQCFPDLPMRFVKEDAAKVSVENMGRFDGILLSGLLYHFDAPDIIPILTRLREMSDVLLIDSHTSRIAAEKYVVPGSDLTLYGRSCKEHRENKPIEEREKNYWSSYHNNFSFWLTENSLTNALHAAGYTLSAKLCNPSYVYPWKDRGLWIASVESDGASFPAPAWPEPDRRMEESELFVRCLTWPDNPSTQRL